MEIGFLVVAMVVVGGGALLYHFVFSERARNKRALRKAARVPIAKCKDGELVKICGTLSYAGEPIAAPLSNRPCALFQVQVRQRKGSGKNSHWVTIIEETDFARELWLDDGTGRALVQLTYPRIVLVMDQHYASGVLNDATPQLEDFLARHGKSSQGWIFNKNLRYKEGVLEQGERVAVLGVARWEPDPDPAAASRGGGYRDRAMRLRVVDPAEGQMLLSDDPSTQ